MNRSSSPHHRDYGVIEVEGQPTLKPVVRDELERYVRDGRWRRPPQEDFAWASLTNFWCVKDRYLARLDSNQSTFNRVIGRPEPKTRASQGDSWLAGRRPDRQQHIEAESKKVVSFKEPPRTFGFMKPRTVSPDEIKSLLRAAWPELQDDEFVTDDEILRGSC